MIKIIATATMTASMMPLFFIYSSAILANSSVTMDFEYANLTGVGLEAEAKNEIKVSSDNQFELAWWSRLDCNRAKVVTDESYTGSASLQVFYPKNHVLSDSAENTCDGSGTQFQIEFNERLGETSPSILFSHYAVKLSADFSYGSDPGHEVIKLPGIAAENGASVVCSGKNKCVRNNFSYRLSIRNADKYALKTDIDYSGGSLFAYGYDSTTKCDAGEYYDLMIPTGETIYLKPDGQWHVIDSIVKINSFDLSGSPVANGEFQLFFDGQQVFFNNKMTIVNDFLEKKNVDVFYFSTFYGGKDDENTADIIEYSPQSDSYAYFDDLRVGKSFSDVAGKSVATFDKSSAILHVPSVDVGGKVYDVKLVKNEATGSIVVTSLTELENIPALLKFIPEKELALTVVEVQQNNPVKTTMESISFQNGVLKIKTIQNLNYRNNYPNRRLCFR